MCRFSPTLLRVLAACILVLGSQASRSPAISALETVNDNVRLQGERYYDRISTLQQSRLQYDFGSVIDSASTPLYGDQPCIDMFGSTAKSNAVTWTHAFCWTSTSWAQGITGSEEAKWRSAIGYRNILIVSWYERLPDDQSGPSRISLVDLDRGVFRNVSLVMPGANGELSAIKSHAGGLAWVGPYLYMASTNSIYVFNLNHFFRGGDDIFLAASERWFIQDTDDDVSQYNISSLSARWLDGYAELIGVQYGNEGDGDDTHIFHWALNQDERLVSSASLVAESTAHVRVQTVGFVQGVEMYGRYYLLNCSNASVTGQGDQFDFLFRIDSTDGSESTRNAWQMPRWNGQDLYIDDYRGLIWSLTEGPDDHEVASAVSSHPTTWTFLYAYSWNGIL